MLNSTITLDQIVVASKASGIAIADLILAIDSGHRAAQAEAVVPAPPKAAPAPKAVKPVAAPKATPKAVKPVKVKASKAAAKQVAAGDWRNRPMSKKQSARIYKVCDQHGFFYPTNMATMTAGQASDFYKAMVAAI